MQITTNGITAAKSKQIAPVKINQKQHENLSWFSSMVERGRNEVFSEIVIVTLELAKQILDNNPDNRNINENKVAEIAADMRNGRWKLNGEAIIVSREGFLNDGQHRLYGSVASGRAFESVVIFGVSRDSRYTVDMGTSRSVAQFIGMEGAKNATHAAAAARVWHYYRRGLFHNGAPGDGTTRQAVRNEYWQYRDQIEKAIKRVDSKYAVIVGRVPLIVAHMAISAACADANAIEAFFHGVLTGENLSKSDPRLFLRTHLLEAKQTRLQSFRRLELVLRYWNNFRTGVKRSQKLRASDLGAYPKVER